MGTGWLLAMIPVKTLPRGTQRVRKPLPKLVSGSSAAVVSGSASISATRSATAWCTVARVRPVLNVTSAV